ncbi:MAG TPA: aminopeptidase P family protein, partial [Candidatus Binatia bacterium]|nr:aminopeptidase P family protein [Candidatus Binatia bacterium]
MLSLPAAQQYMRENGIDAWLLCDYRGNNQLFWQALGVARNPTRRAFLIVPRSGKPLLLTHIVDQFFFHDITLPKRIYKGWVEMREILCAALGDARKLALEYSVDGGVPTVSWVDAGTVELLRSWGHEIVTSADLFQVSAAAWDDFAIDSHKR